MGTEPIEDEIPVDFSDFPIEMQQALLFYNKFPDIYEGMSGVFLGKNFSSAEFIFNSFDITLKERASLLDLMLLIDSCRAEILAEKVKAKSKKK